jgi:hypothetical protein
MSDEEFLKRWSRRKQEARKEDMAAEQAPPPAAATPADPAEPELDLSKLPPLDSITAATDITEFLRKGVPAELRSAALRRAWAADPAIRDFVGLAENAWDFTDPNAMPGFGALHSTPEQIGAMVERVFGGARDVADKFPVPGAAFRLPPRRRKLPSAMRCAPTHKQSRLLQRNQKLPIKMARICRSGGARMAALCRADVLRPKA